MSGGSTTVTVYGRRDCHLCDDALEQIRAIADAQAGIELNVIDIEDDDELMKRYLERIPVVVADGEVVSDLVFDPSLLRARLGIA